MLPQIVTASGSVFSFTDPESSTFDINDIAHSLSHIARFTGHTSKFYSVCQHSVIGSKHIDEKFALQFLLHDAAEAFCGDVSTPLKHMLRDVYKPIEERVERAIMHKFSVKYPLPVEVKKMDQRMFASEVRDLMPKGVVWDIPEGVEPLAEYIYPVRPEEAKRQFLERFYELTAKQ